MPFFCDFVIFFVVKHLFLILFLQAKIPKFHFTGLYVWGRLMTTEAWELERTEHDYTKEKNPGVFHLAYPYENYVCLVDERNPVRLLNDYRGIVGAKINTIFEVDDQVLELMLNPEQGLQKLIYNKSIVDIEVGEQLFCDYGINFWDEEASSPRHTIKTQCTLTKEAYDKAQQEDALCEDDEDSEQEVGRPKRRAADGGNTYDSGNDDDKKKTSAIPKPSKRQTKKPSQRGASQGSETDLYDTQEKPKAKPRAKKSSNDVREEVTGMEAPDDDSDSHLQPPTQKKQKKKSAKAKGSPIEIDFDSEDEPLQVGKPSKARCVHFFGFYSFFMVYHM